MNPTQSASRLEGRHFLSGENIVVEIGERKISDIRVLEDGHGRRLPWIGPGLVDLQVNGYAGLDFNAPDLDAEVVQRITQALWQEGVTSYLPTVITNTDHETERSLRTIASARLEEELLKRTIAGIHLEGPFISPEDGPRGAHDRVHVKAPDWGLFKRWQEAAEDSIRIVTLSPEWPGACGFIERCVGSGVIVSIGHTAATPEQIRDAVAAGASMSTHLGNGAHPSLPRHPNYIWEQLAQDGLWACVIADGFHLPDSVLKVVLRTKGPNALLVSDVTSFGGMRPGEYTTHVGGRVILARSGRLQLADDPNLLAGSAQPLRIGVEHLTNSGLCGMGEAWEMASSTPGFAAGLPSGSGLKAGAPADLVRFVRVEGRLEVEHAYKAGRRVAGCKPQEKEEGWTTP